MRLRFLAASLVAAALLLILPVSPLAAQVYVSSLDGTVAEYSTAGVALGAPTTVPNISAITGMAASANGSSLYFSDLASGAVEQYNIAKNTFSSFGTLPGGGPGGAIALGVGAMSGEVFVGGPAGDVYAFAGAGSTPVSIAALSGDTTPYVGGMAVGSDGSLYVGDLGPIYNATGPGTIEKITFSGSDPSSYTVSPFITGTTGTFSPAGLLWHGGDLYVSDQYGNQISEYNSAGHLLQSFSLPNISPPSNTPPDFNYLSSPATLVADGTGTGFYVALTGATDYPGYNEGVIGHYSWSLSPIGGGVFASGLDVPTSVAVVPEPSTAALAFAALIGLLAFARWRTRKRRAQRILAA